MRGTSDSRPGDVCGFLAAPLQQKDLAFRVHLNASPGVAFVKPMLNIVLSKLEEQVWAVSVSSGLMGAALH